MSGADAAPAGARWSGSDAAPAGARWGGVDALRAAAILSVVVYHFYDRFDWSFLGFTGPRGFAFPGWIGVDLFFIVSAYCIASTLGRSPSPARFLALRLARLWPAYIAAIALTWTTVSAFGPTELERSAGTALANMVWLNALSPLVPHVDGVYWSLIAELQFYVAICVLHFTLRDPRRVILAWCAFVIAGAVLEAASPRAAARILIYPYSAMFLAGLAMHHWRALAPALRGFALALVVAASLTAERYAEAPALPLIAVAAAALGFVFRDRVSSPALNLIALVSYAWYLVHQYVGVAIIRELNAAGLEAISAPAAIAITFALAWAISAAVELRWRAPLARRIEAGIGRLGTLALRRA